MCEKYKYTTEKAAFAAANSKNIPLYTYFCNICGFYHITKYNNLIKTPLYLNNTSYLYTRLYKAIHNRQTSKCQLSNRCTQHICTINGTQYVFVYNKSTKSITVNAVLVV